MQVVVVSENAFLLGSVFCLTESQNENSADSCLVSPDSCLLFASFITHELCSLLTGAATQTSIQTQPRRNPSLTRSEQSSLPMNAMGDGLSGRANSSATDVLFQQTADLNCGHVSAQGLAPKPSERRRRSTNG